jgi:hypothetical protein
LRKSFRVFAEPAISLHSHHVSLVQWTTCFLPVMRDPGSDPKGVLMWNRDSPVSIVSLHWWPRRDPITGFVALKWVLHKASRWQCVNRPDRLDHTALLSRFHTRCRSPFWLHNHRVGCWGEALWRACNLTLFSPCLTGPVDYLFASCHEGPGFKPHPGGYLCEAGILLLALPRYKSILFFFLFGQCWLKILGRATSDSYGQNSWQFWTHFPISEEVIL